MISCMKKKKPGQDRPTPRKTVQIPQDWLRVIQEMAAARPMPVMWLLVEWAKREAEAKGKKDLPPVPWDLPKADEGK